MFKLSKLILKTNKGDREILLNNFSYIYGRHDRGKTVFLDVIDFMMGDSEYNYANKQAMRGVNSIELRMEIDKRCLWLCRDEKNFFYKLSDEDQRYIRVINIEEYKEKILSFIIADNYDVLDDYKALTGKNISYRSLSLFNYLPESGIADITNVFPKSKEIGELLNIKSIMLYIFNKENVLRITKLKTENARLEKEIKELRQPNDGSIYCEKIIRENMSKLSLNNTDSILKLKEQFKEYQKTLSLKKEEVKNKDLLYLIKASQLLAEEIKYQMFLEEQSKYETKDLDNSNKLLEMLSGILIKNDDNKEVVNILKQDILRNKQDILFLNGKDYKKSLENLKLRKAGIDKQIGQINRGLDKYSYDDKMKIINILDNAFQNYRADNLEEKIKEKEKTIQENNKTINTLSNGFNQKTLNSFNVLLTNIYKKFDKLEFVKKDLQKESFQLRFNPAKVSVSAIEVKRDDDGNSVEVAYVPGSKARMTLWQLATYMAMCVFIKNNFNGMPFAQYICVDAVVQEFVDEKEPTNEIIDCMKDFVEKNEMQMIIVGALDPIKLNLSSDQYVNIDNGLNPAFSY